MLLSYLHGDVLFSPQARGALRLRGAAPAPAPPHQPRQPLEERVDQLARPEEAEPLELVEKRLRE